MCILCFASTPPVPFISTSSPSNHSDTTSSNDGNIDKESTSNNVDVTPSTRNLKRKARENARVSLVLCFNRDVLSDRPFEMPTFHSDGLFYGLDVPSKGTWLSVAPNGGFVAILDHDELKEDAVDKGGPGLPRGLLALQRHTEEAKTPIPEWWRYAGYNLVQGNLRHDISSWVVHTNRPKPGCADLMFPVRNFELSGNSFALANGSIARGPDHGGPKVAYAKRAAGAALHMAHTDGLSAEQLAISVRDELAVPMSRDVPFEGLPSLDQFKAGVYASLEEFTRCQAPFVNKLPSWATASQQIIVRVDERIFHFCRIAKNTEPGKWKMDELCASQSPAAL